MSDDLMLLLGSNPDAYLAWALHGQGAVGTLAASWGALGAGPLHWAPAGRDHTTPEAVALDQPARLGAWLGWLLVYHRVVTHRMAGLGRQPDQGRLIGSAKAIRRRFTGPDAVAFATWVCKEYPAMAAKLGKIAPPLAEGIFQHKSVLGLWDCQNNPPATPSQPKTQTASIEQKLESEKKYGF